MSRRLLLWFLVCGSAQAQMLHAPSLHGTGHETDQYGRAWYSQRIIHEVTFGTGTTLNAEARESLSLSIDGARRFFGTTKVCVVHDSDLVSRESKRLAYLRWWLKLQDVGLEATADSLHKPQPANSAPGAAVMQ